MGQNDCTHPKRKVRIAHTAGDEEVGQAPPMFWTITGECECGELVQIDYKFNKITK